MKLTIVQTRLGTFNEYILRDESGRYLRADGIFTGNEEEARRFVDVEHASEVANQTEAAPAAPAAEVKVLDPDHVEIYLPAGATLPAEYAGWVGQQSDWDPPSGEQRLHLARPQATSAPTVHVRLAWLALVLLLSAPFFAVADPPSDAGTVAPADAGVEVPRHPTQRRQPTHWERWPQGGPLGGSGDEPNPSTGNKAG